MRLFVRFKIFVIALVVTILVVVAKYFLHASGIEPIEQTSIHNGVVSSVIFVVGFVLSATITDYKESERIPADFAAMIQDMFEDAAEIKKTHQKFDI